MLAFWILATLLFFGIERYSKHCKYKDMDKEPYIGIKSAKYCAEHNMTSDEASFRAIVWELRDICKSEKEHAYDVAVTHSNGCGYEIKSHRELFDRFWDQEVD